MGNSAKTDNFLKAIKRYAKVQQSALDKEMKQLKQEKTKLTAEKAAHDSEKLIADRLEQKRSEQTGVLAKKTQEGQKALFLQRAQMTDEVFAKAEKKLTDYAQTAEYRKKLTESAQKIAALFGGRPCVLYISENDSDFAESILKVFNGTAELQTDKTIKIGGVKGYCKSMRVIADETLDSKLLAQREWFIENAALSVL